MSDSQRSRGLGAAARVSALAASVMDLHVRIALQEVNREKRRLISGGIFLIFGLSLLLFALLAIEVSCIFWTQKNLGWPLEFTLIITAFINLIFAGISLRLGGQLSKGPYLPETIEGISKTTKAVLGKE